MSILSGSQNAAVKGRLNNLGSTAFNKGKSALFSNPIGALNVAGTGFGISRRMKNGDSFLSSAMKETAENMMYVTHPGLMMAMDLAPLAYQGVKGARDFRERRTEEFHDMRYNSYGRIGGGYEDTNRALTMRQAAVQQIQGNKLNARSALGGEARIFSNNIY